MRREVIERLISLGTNVFRLNFSHGDHEFHAKLIAAIRSIAGRLDVPVAILQDISGPKIRVGPINGIMRLTEGDRLIIRTDSGTLKDNEITITHPEIIQALKPGDHIHFADGTIRTRVFAVAKKKVVTRILVGGKLSTGKGLNLPGARLAISAVTEKDRRDIAFGVSHGVDLMALSFIRSAADIIEAREVVTNCGGDTPLIAKIEKAEALENLEEIMNAANGIMVARGDLGVELGVHQVPAAQKLIISKARLKGIPVITATQMLTSMLSSPYPTRAEISDIANTVLDGTDAVMLSDETAVGSYPEEAVTMLNDTISAAETIYPFNQIDDDLIEPHEAVANAAATLAGSCCRSAAVVVFTQSGLSARMVARIRPQTRIIGVTSNPLTFRRLALSWGIEPFFLEYSHTSSDKAIALFYRNAIAAGLLTPEDSFVVTIGMHSNQSGATNQIQLMDKNCMARLQTAIKSD